MKTRARVLFIHGLESHPQGSKTRMVREQGFDVVAPDLHMGIRHDGRELEKRGLGRVHHRVLYFIRRNERLTVGELVAILGVTKQALHRPLSARRARIAGPVRPASSLGGGCRVRGKLSGMQREHFARAFERGGERGWRQVMAALADLSALRAADH